MLQLTLITKTKPNQMEGRLIEVARQLIGELKTRSQVLEALQAELHSWKTTRQKYRHAGTTVSLNMKGNIQVTNQEGQAVFTID